MGSGQGKQGRHGGGPVKCFVSTEYMPNPQIKSVQGEVPKEMQLGCGRPAIWES